MCSKIAKLSASFGADVACHPPRHRDGVITRAIYALASATDIQRLFDHGYQADSTTVAAALRVHNPVLLRLVTERGAPWSAADRAEARRRGLFV